MDDELPTILCPLCGAQTQSSNDSNMCANCLKGQVDITDGITKNVTLFYCKGCGRYLGQKWMLVDLESPELLAICLKKIKGLGKLVKLVNASFIWTEPHSRRIKIKLTLQKSVFNVIMQQTCVVEFVVAYQQCEECQRSWTEHTWTTVVQVRQKVRHKRTFLWLEQLLLKHKITALVQSIKEQPDGLDFYWESRQNAAALVNFLQEVTPMRKSDSKRLISQDLNSNHDKYKFTILVELAQICRDDLVVLPPKIAASYGGVGPLMLCTKISSQLHLVDPSTLQAIELNSTQYFRTNFAATLGAKSLTEFVVLDIEKSEDAPFSSGASQSGKEPPAGKFVLAEVQVVRLADFGVNDITFTVMTHLGHYLNSGDHVLGYDLTTANLGDQAVKQLKRGIPDVVLVRKTFPSRKNRQRKRRWELKRLNIVQTEQREKPIDSRRRDEELEKFMQDIEEDPELQDKVLLFRRDRTDSVSTMGDADLDDGFPGVPLDKLLDGMSLQHSLPEAAAAAAAAAGDEDMDGPP